MNIHCDWTVHFFWSLRKTKDLKYSVELYVKWNLKSTKDINADNKSNIGIYKNDKQKTNENSNNNNNNKTHK